MENQENNESKVVYHIPQMTFGFNDERYVEFEGDKFTSLDAANIIRAAFDEGEIDMRESFIVLFFNEANEPIGTYKHTTGGRDQTLVDLGLVMGAALTSLSTGLILAHNHPVGNPNPSQADLEITLQFIEAANLLNLRIIDHIVLTKDNHVSMAEYGLIGKESPYPLIHPPGLLNPDDIDLSASDFIIESEDE